ncbi:hypothetical protein BG74_00745 [Sodalis-like endosymbiont of Proechinophthirus fluctus]|uniref:hypothetical protein n=1 Tax=Sodalis-like endosymbiont of Proechinophthirus fluctus TaxID=1462730 RepID=UPI0007A8C81E|nr:hypothetical protein [Sodalis-like endosymbiont of Proechinophthirus fluctus]KYP97737.1 hypothetical protein BG74_00745 [Sodalis-like endosymbiont of Proechinophthirus fluctus]
MIGNMARELYFARCHHYGLAFFGQLLHDTQHFVDQLLVQRRGWFIKQQRLRFHHRHVSLIMRAPVMEPERLMGYLALSQVPSRRFC